MKAHVRRNAYMNNTRVSCARKQDFSKFEMNYPNTFMAVVSVDAHVLAAAAP